MKLSATRRQIKASMIGQHGIEDSKVRNLVTHLRKGGKIAPVVVAVYGDSALPLDGHHRMLASAELGLPVDAWVVAGKAFDRLCAHCRNAEAFVECDGIPAMQVAEKWTQAIAGVNDLRPEAGCS